VNIDKQEVIREYIKHRLPTKVAKNLGYSIRDVLPIIDEYVGNRTVREEKFGGFGPEHMRKYIVGRKAVVGVWNNNDPQIAQARLDFEAGTHTMTTGRDGDWLLLYSIPLRKRDPKIGYFLPEF
jgi:hypothetical protein